MVDKVRSSVRFILRGVSYARVSDDGQYKNEDGTERKDASPEAQKNRSEEHVAYLNRKNEGKQKYELIDHLVDKGLSGKDTNRRAYQRLCELTRRKQIDFVICSELSRLSRSVADFLALVKLCEENNVRIIVIGLDLDTSTAYGRFVVIILIALAQLEREVTSTRVRENSRIRLIRDGKINGAKEILGLVRDPNNAGHFLVDEDGLETAEKLLRLFLKFSSKKKLLAAAKEKELKGIRGKELTIQTIEAVLSNVRWRYRGLWHLNLENMNVDPETLPEPLRFRTVQLPHKQLLPSELLDEVESKQEVAEAKKFRTGKDDYIYLLSGVLLGEDGSRFSGAPGNGNGGEYRYYKNEKFGVNIRCDELDPYIIKRLKSYLTDSEVFERLLKRALEQRAARLGDLEQERQALTAEIVDLGERRSALQGQVIGMLKADNRDLVGKWLGEQLAEIESLMGSKTRSLDDLARRKDEVVRQTGLTDLKATVREFIDSFDEFTDVERRGLIQRIIEKIVVRKPNQIEIVLYADPPVTSKVITRGKKVELRSEMVGLEGLEPSTNGL